MHISDGVLSAPVWIGGYVVSASIIALTTRRMDPEDMPRVAVMIVEGIITGFIVSFLAKVKPEILERR